MNHLDELAGLVRAHHFDYVKEADLQAGLLRLFTEHGLIAVREAQLPNGQRIDLAVAFGAAADIGVEVKVAGSPADVRRQLARYAATGKLAGLLLVTTRSLHRQFDHTTSHGIPIRVVQPAWL